MKPETIAATIIGVFLGTVVLLMVGANYIPPFWWLQDDVRKAEAERRREINRRTAQIIRERGWDTQRAREAAVREYEADLQETTR